MARHWPVLEQIQLRGLTAAPSQVCGGIRLVPLLRELVREDLRLACRSYDTGCAVVSLGGNEFYASYIPHALVLSWSDDGSPAAAYGGQLFARDERAAGRGPCSVQMAHRMARRLEPNRLRFLPLHLAMEGFLDLHFGGPDIAWEEYSRAAISTGLSPRTEYSYAGRAIPGLEDALRVFEIHEGQVGVLVFVADALASAFATPHPEDYRLLHRSLLEDFYWELIYQYGILYPNTAHIESPVCAERASTLADLRGELQRIRREWGEFHQHMAGGILGAKVQSQRIYHTRAFQLERFTTSLHPSTENHLGEAITREDGTLEYLKTYRLSAAQVRRAYLLQQLATYHWNLETTATALHTTREELIIRLDRAGFAYLLHEHVLKTAQKRQRERMRK